MLINYIFLAISSSLDSIGIGITYGIKNTQISFSAKIILWIISYIMVIVAVLLSSILAKIFSEKIVQVIGGAFLIFLGINTISKIGIKPFNTYDMDKSNVIDAKEALALGLFTSIDAFCIGICASAYNLSILLFPFLVSFFQLVFLSFGNRLGKKVVTTSELPSWMWQLLSGLILIVIGYLKIFKL